MSEDEVGEGVSIDDYATWRATRFASPEEGFASAAEDSWKCVGSRGQMGSFRWYWGRDRMVQGQRGGVP